MMLVRRNAKFDPLIATAMRHFAQKGYDGTATLEIAKEINVTEPLIYYYFPTKSEFYTYVALRVHSRYRQLLLALPETGEPWMRMKELVKAHKKFAAKRPFEAMLATRPVPGNMESGRLELEKSAFGIRKELKGRLSANLRDGIAEGIFARIDVPATTNLLAVMLFHLLELPADSRAKVGTKAFLSFLKRGIEAGPFSLREPG